MQVRIACVALLLFAFEVAAVADEPQRVGDDVDVIKFNPTLVRLNVRNDMGCRLFLWRVEGNTFRMVYEFKEERNLAVDVPSGIYYVTNFHQAPVESPVQVAVPALAEAITKGKEGRTGRLSIDITVRANPEHAEQDEVFAWIPAGPALIGDHLGVGQPDEQPARIEYVNGYWMGRYEVTNAQYVRFLNDQAAVDAGWLDLRSRKCRIKKLREKYETAEPEFPVVTVTLAGAEAFCNWLSQTTGRKCRLPTEIEWEKGARGPASLVYSYGNVYRPEAANQESGQLMPVGKFARNSYGLYDMTGNAFEWVAGQHEKIPADQPMKNVLRGGSFVLDGMYLRNSFRMRQSPTTMTDDFGFRVLREATESELRK